jgi:hypothetical protein
MVLTMEEGAQFDVIPNGVYHVGITDTEENVKMGEWENRNRLTVTVLDGEYTHKTLNRYFGKLSMGSLLNTEVLTKAGIVLAIGSNFELSDLCGYVCDITVVTKKTTKGGTFSNIMAWDNFVKPTRSPTKSRSEQKNIASTGKASSSVDPLICTQCGEYIPPGTPYHADENGNIFHDQYGKRCRDAYLESLEKAKDPKKKKVK